MLREWWTGKLFRPQMAEKLLLRQSDRRPMGEEVAVAAGGSMRRFSAASCGTESAFERVA